MSRETWEYSRETASKKVTGIILFMIVLALCFNTSAVNISYEFKEIISGGVVAIYLMVALGSSLDSHNSENNTWVAFVKFVLIYSLCVSGIILALLISIIFAVSMILLYQKQYIKNDRDKITFAEIILLCVENLVVSIVLLVFSNIESTYFTIVKVVFEETFLYSLNYLVLFAVKEKIYSL